MKAIGYTFVVLLIIAALFLLSIAFKTCGEAADVAHDEFGPRALLEKYEWFKDVLAELDRKRADMSVYQIRLDVYKEDYGDTPVGEWPRDDRMSYRQSRTELLGMVSLYNDLAAEYNAQMAKFNWQFCNAGTLPEGAKDPLPREVVPYIYE